MKRNLTKKDLRIFSLVFSFIVALFSIKFSKLDNVFIGGILLTLSLTICVIGILLPVLIMPVYRTLSFIGRIVGTIVTVLLLSIVFYCIFTPIRVILKATKKDILGLKIDKNEGSYWIKRKDRFIKPESLERQF